MKATWTQDLICAGLRELAEAKGRAPTANEVRLASRELLPAISTIERHFGTYANALRAAGMEPCGRTAPSWATTCPTCGRARHARPGEGVCRSCRDAAKRARVADDVILAALRDLARRVGDTPTQEEWDAHQPLPLTSSGVRHRFGTWANAWSRAGLPPRERATGSRKVGNAWGKTRTMVTGGGYNASGIFHIGL